MNPHPVTISLLSFLIGVFAMAGLAYWFWRATQESS